MTRWAQVETAAHSDVQEGPRICDWERAWQQQQSLFARSHIRTWITVSGRHSNPTPIKSPVIFFYLDTLVCVCVCVCVGGGVTNTHPTLCNALAWYCCCMAIDSLKSVSVVQTWHLSPAAVLTSVSSVEVTPATTPPKLGQEPSGATNESHLSWRMSRPGPLAAVAQLFDLSALFTSVNNML